MARAHWPGEWGVLPKRWTLRRKRLLGMAAPKTARTHRLGGQGVPPRRQWPPEERLWGMTASIGAGPLAETGTPAQAVVAA